MQRPQSINWDFYREKLGPGIVNIFENSINCEPRTIASTACSISSFFTPGATVFRNVYIEPRGHSSRSRAIYTENEFLVEIP
jgi:hypothetical protein